MTSIVEDPHDIVYYNPQDFANVGGYLHINNGKLDLLVSDLELIRRKVFYYFRGSPWFDGNTDDLTVINQYQGSKWDDQILGHRDRFEEELRQYTGKQYHVLVRGDTILVDTPAGPQPSTIWVIRKHLRNSPEKDDVTPLEYFYIINGAIYRAPSVASVMKNRLVGAYSVAIMSLANLYSSIQSPP